VGVDEIIVVDNSWVCTDNTYIGTPGIIDGTVTLWGLSTPGDYEARLFFNGPSYRLRESKRRLKQNRPDTDDPPDHEQDDRQEDRN